MKNRRLIVAAISVLSSLVANAQSTPAQQWVDQTYKTLSDDEKIAQLVIIRAYSNKGIEANV
ncbi:MAG TPA: hypothetical protein VL943_04080, partial [Niabella sp.]|nr:hypothetical protein [Niabella sp.]